MQFDKWATELVADLRPRLESVPEYLRHLVLHCLLDELGRLTRCHFVAAPGACGNVGRLHLSAPGGEELFSAALRAAKRQGVNVFLGGASEDEVVRSEVSHCAAPATSKARKGI